MRQKVFEDIPGVGEIVHYRQDPLELDENLWLDGLAFLAMREQCPIPLAELQSVCNFQASSRILLMPFLKIEDKHISFRNQKYEIAAALIPIYEALSTATDLPNLYCLVPYDHISYFRPVIEAGDSERIIQCIEASSNEHYIRLLFMLLRNCAVEGNKSWLPWIEQYVGNLSPEIRSYPEFTVQRDSRVTQASVAGSEVLLDFLERMESDPELSEYEGRHFVESCGTPQRAGEILFHKVIQPGYRQAISPINIFGLS